MLKVYLRPSSHTHNKRTFKNTRLDINELKNLINLTFTNF